jgi:hypothetical protein
VPKGVSGQTAHAITTGSHLAFMSGFSSALAVASVVALVAAFAALLVRRGSTAVTAAGV